MSTQVILELRPDGGYFASVVTREGQLLAKDAILTWADEMRWINTARAMRQEWDSHGLAEWDAYIQANSQTVGTL
jgi:hypothetical protein